MYIIQHSYCDFGDPVRSLEGLLRVWNPEKVQTYLPEVASRIHEREKLVLEQKRAEEEEVKRLEEEIKRLESEYATYEKDNDTSDNESDEEEYIGLVKVLHDYEAEEDNELNLKAGETIGVLQKHESGWWKGEVRTTLHYKSLFFLIRTTSRNTLTLNPHMISFVCSLFFFFRISMAR